MSDDKKESFDEFARRRAAELPGLLDRVQALIDEGADPGGEKILALRREIDAKLDELKRAVAARTSDA